MDLSEEVLELIAAGNALEDAGDPASAVNRYERAIAVAPTFARARLNLGNALLSMQDFNGALAAYGAAVDLDPSCASGHCNLGNTHLRMGRPDVSKSCYRRALALDPQHLGSAMGLGYSLTLLGDADEAIAIYRWVLTIQSDFQDAHVSLGNLFKSQGKFEEAVSSYRDALSAGTSTPDLSLELGNSLLALDRPVEAFNCLQQAVANGPDLPHAHYALGNALHRLRRLNEAAASYERAVQIHPGFAEAYWSAGNVFQELREFDLALTRYRNAMEISPAIPQLHFNIGIVLANLGRFDNAILSYRRALQLNPDYLEAHNNLGNVLKECGQLDEAVQCFKLALSIDSGHVAALCNLGNAMRQLGRNNEARESYQRAIQSAPDHAEAHRNLGTVLQEAGHLDEAATSYREAVRLKPDFPEAFTDLLFCLSHDYRVTPERLYAEHVAFGGNFEPSPIRAGPTHSRGRDPTRSLRVGFVSGDLRNHAIAYFIEPVLRELAESSSLRLFAYHNHRAEDATSVRLQRHFKRWNSIAGLSDEELAHRVADDAIDVLIDLSGHTAKNRLLAFARKPAPIQASWIGYPGTTGLRAMDYYLADRHFLPLEEFSGQFTEKLVHLPAVAPFLPEPGAPAVGALPALRMGHVTFGSFNRLSKLSPRVIALWSRLLRAMPGARMLLGAMPQDGQYGQLVEWFAGEGIARDRLEFHARCDTATYLALHHRVDICLDTFPYTGGTTTVHALWMGVPTLTLAGHTPASRHGATVMGHLGLDGLVAKDVDDFERKGLRWATDLDALARLRAQMRERFLASNVARPDVIAEGLERALRIMWQRWCAGDPPAPIQVEN